MIWSLIDDLAFLYPYLVGGTIGWGGRRLLIVHGFPYFSAWRRKRYGYPPADVKSRRAVVGFSKNWKRVRIMIKCFAGWIDTEWEPARGIVWEIWADRDDKTGDDIDMDIWLRGEGWRTVTVEIPDDYLYWTRQAGGTALLYARQVLRVNNPGVRTNKILFHYLKMFRASSMPLVADDDGAEVDRQRGEMERHEAA